MPRGVSGIRLRVERMVLRRYVMLIVLGLVRCGEID